METIGERVRKLRDSKNIERKDLARDAGMSYTALSDLELGKTANTTKLRKLAALLGVDVDYLESGKGQSDLHGTLTRSQSVRLDPAIVRSVARALRKVYAEAGREYVLEEEPERFVWLYEIGASAGEAAAPDNMVRLLLKQDSTQARASTDERVDGVPVGGTVEGGNGRRTAKA
jgi:transcriptional regulator with XRE-family HTH domain